MDDKKGFWRSVNPTIKEKMEANPNLTVIGLFWAGYWRLTVAIFAVWAAIAIVFILLALSTGFGNH